MTQLISHPFRLAPDGSVACREDSSDEYRAERIALLCLTLPEERPLVPEFGVEDPTFRRFSAQSLQEQVIAFLPDTTITKIDTHFVSETAQTVAVEFE